MVASAQVVSQSLPFSNSVLLFLMFIFMVPQEFLYSYPVPRARTRLSPGLPQKWPQVVCVLPRPSWALDAVLGAEGVQPLRPALTWGAFGQHWGK